MANKKRVRNLSNLDFEKVANDSNINRNTDTQNHSDNKMDKKERIEDILYTPLKGETTTFRGFYLDNDIIKVIDRNTGKQKGDKSDLVNYVLRKFFRENGYL